MKYLRQQDCSSRTIPTSADSVFSQSDTFRKYLQNLDVTTVLYNRINETVLDVEYPLIEGKLKAINEQLEKATSHINWTSEGKDMQWGWEGGGGALLYSAGGSIVHCSCTLQGALLMVLTSVTATSNAYYHCQCWPLPLSLSMLAPPTITANASPSHYINPPASVPNTPDESSLGTVWK